MFKRIYIEITNSCNLNCIFCSKNNRHPRMMSRTEFSYVLDQIKPLTEHIYLHVQGEPFMHPELLDFLDDSYKYGLKVHLVTNGTLLSKVDSRLYSHPALVQLSISIHSAQMKIDDDNYKILKQIISNVENTQLSLFLRLWTYNDNELTYLINSLTNNLIIYEGKRIKVKKNLYIDLDKEFVWPNINHPIQSINGTCHAGSIMLAILSNGEITPCCLDSDGLLSIGNIFEETLNDCISKPRFTNLVNGFKKRQCVETLCQKCTYRLRFNK
jgi:radical SAM protein with 4Fe4S-binding SPASM domain